MAEIVRNYFTPGWRTDRIACVCGWDGDPSKMQMELHEEVTDYACPACESTLLIVSHPDIDQVRQAAADGNAEAQQQLALVEEALALHGKGDR
ncbi:hypothetical protein [Pseudoxanthomonas sacheonensis]|uniref:hypothetical protein n=1 Tax=Pseudoxanthomonas sacheonensis TaxID=443615 RepID=UPI0013D28E6C|nr:hypothetical protein [Pseudoxanthomonas sacheonensis]KAF1712951.1 hypothetical protein CSC73_01310 [Pseudoxanthomonas sacheonensis]